MEKDLIQDTISKIEKWCKENNLSIFYGTIEEAENSNSTDITWTNKSDSDWELYLESIKKLDAKMIILHSVTNDIDVNDEEIIYHKTTIENEDLIEYNQALEVIKKTNGQTLYFSLYFICNNVYYSYSQSAEWYKEYDLIEESLDYQEQEYEEEDNDDENEEEIEFSEIEIQTIARKVTSNEKFLSEKDSYKRYEIINSFMEKENLEKYSNNRQLVEEEISNIYENEIKPKAEEDFKLKVLELKDKKLKKVEIAAKLKVSIATVNKFYYSDAD